MQKNGQRQDIAFLALAVAVLAIAVALFFGMKNIGKEPPKAPEPEPVEQVEVTEPIIEEPDPGVNGRDPFKTQPGATASSAASGGSNEGLKLVGILMEQGSFPMAVIHSAKKRYYARVGEKAAGYEVISVGDNTAVLQKDGHQITLVLREPESEE